MYEVRWRHEAIGDLRTKVKTRPVRHHLLVVARSSLDRHFPEWGGRSTNFLWRRGVTAQDEARIARAERRGEGRDDGTEQARDFVLVYFQSWRVVPLRLFEVVEVYTNGEMATGLRPGAGRWRP